MDIRTLVACLTMGSFLALSPVMAIEEASAKPRYHLAAGREFSFHNETRSERKGSGTESGVYFVDWKIWTIGRAPDGAWRLVIRCDLKSPRAKPEGLPDQDQGQVDTLVWRCRLFEDGRLVGASEMGTVRDPFRLFPRLPDGPDDLGRGWTSAGSDKEMSKLQHRTTPGKKSDSENLFISTKAESLVDKVYESSHTYHATFDQRRGVVTRVETEDKSGYPSVSDARGTIELVGVEDRGEAWAVGFGQEADRYFDAVEAYDAARKRALRDAAHCKEIFAEAKEKLEAARTGLKTPVFRDAIGQTLAEHSNAVEYGLEQAKNYSAHLGKAAEEWASKDLNGKPHRLADYRGKVVVMDFWYRGCGWCMFAMPQVNRLSEAFRDEPVAVLGMTIDEDEKDARIVVEAMGLKYPAIKAAGIPPKYGVDGYPTLVVVDKVGKVREIHVGYSPHLYDELSEQIRTLLAEKPAE